MHRMISRKVTSPTSSPLSIMTKEPMSCSLIVATASEIGVSGVAVNKVSPLTFRISLTLSMIILPSRFYGGVSFILPYVGDLGQGVWSFNQVFKGNWVLQQRISKGMAYFGRVPDVGVILVKQPGVNKRS